MKQETTHFAGQSGQERVQKGHPCNTNWKPKGKQWGNRLRSRHTTHMFCLSRPAKLFIFSTQHKQTPSHTHMFCLGARFLLVVGCWLLGFARPNTNKHLATHMFCLVAGFHKKELPRHLRRVAGAPLRGAGRAGAAGPSGRVLAKSGVTDGCVGGTLVGPFSPPPPQFFGGHQSFGRALVIILAVSVGYQSRKMESVVTLQPTT